MPFLWALIGLCASAPLAAGAQTPPVSGVYVCVDAKGRRLTADRPIGQCLDREQKVLNPSGTVKTKLGPSLSLLDREELEKKEKIEVQTQAKAMQEKRRNRALLTRYPSEQVYELERTTVLSKMDAALQVTRKRVQELQSQREEIEAKMAQYKADASKSPPALRQQLEDNGRNQREQKHLLAEQEAQAQQAQARFAEQRVRLEPLWSAAAN